MKIADARKLLHLQPSLIRRQLARSQVDLTCDHPLMREAIHGRYLAGSRTLRPDLDCHKIAAFYSREGDFAFDIPLCVAHARGWRRTRGTAAPILWLRRLPIVLACVVLAACVSNEHELRMGSTLAVDSLIACDVGQTVYASDGGRWDRPMPDQPGYVQQETNPLLGHTPSIPLLAGAAAVAIAATTMAGVKLPAWAAYPVLLGVGSVESYLVGKHLSTAGVCGAGAGSIEARR